MTTFKGAPLDSFLTTLIGGGRAPDLTLAEMLDLVSEGPFPISFTAYDGSRTGPPDSEFGVVLKTPRGANFIATAPGDLGLARAFVSGDLDLVGAPLGDPYPIFKKLIEEIRLRRPGVKEVAAIARSLGRDRLHLMTPPPQESLPRWRRVTEGLRGSKSRDAEVISHHYDVSNAFYEKVLGPSMTYTCAVYHSPEHTLEQAQEAKYQLVFDKLGLEPGMRLLDVGCGWGGMVRFAAARGVKAIGVTLSREQAEWANKAIAEQGLGDLAEVRFSDYRDVPETDFDRISSIGITEHIGVSNYPGYFSFLFDKLRPGGRLLNHCITRPRNNGATKAGAFIDRYVFPDGELTGSGQIITVMQDTGFDVRHEENLREHYALTLKQWCKNLVDNWDFCVNEVGEGTARVWGLYMAGSRLGFENNTIQLHQVLGVKPLADGSAAVPLQPWWKW